MIIALELCTMYSDATFHQTIFYHCTKAIIVAEKSNLDFKNSKAKLEL